MKNKKQRLRELSLKYNSLAGRSSARKVLLALKKFEAKLRRQASADFKKPKARNLALAGAGILNSAADLIDTHAIYRD